MRSLIGNGIPLGCCLLSFAAASPVHAEQHVTGTVTFAGKPPPRPTLDRSADPHCSKRDVADPSVTLGKDGKSLQNVYVHIKSKVTAPEVDRGPFAIIDQVDCMYEPRVIGAVVGQKIMVKNADGVMHNVHGYDGTRTVFNQAYPPGAPPIMKPAPNGIKMWKLGCDVHRWMTGYVLISPHPFFSVTGRDGQFDITGVPPGTYELEAWHELLGTRTASITVGKDQTVEQSFTFGSQNDPTPRHGRVATRGSHRQARAGK